MPETESFWDIRFAATVRQMFSRLPRGDAALFDAAVQLLRKGPHPPGVEQIGENLYQYSYNGYRVAFEIALDAKTTVRIIAFKQEQT